LQSSHPFSQRAPVRGRTMIDFTMELRSLVVREGGLLSYGPDRMDQFRRAAGYVDRIFKGEKPRDMPVQASAKYELVINLKTAKSLDLEIPPELLASADEVIE
jgi:putative tryptophan/tyrosine transport system substrate-binding protein